MKFLIHFCNVFLSLMEPGSDAIPWLHGVLLVDAVVSLDSHHSLSVLDEMETARWPLGYRVGIPPVCPAIILYTVIS